VVAAGFVDSVAGVLSESRRAAEFAHANDLECADVPLPLARRIRDGSNMVKFIEMRNRPVRSRPYHAPQTFSLSLCSICNGDWPGFSHNAPRKAEGRRKAEEERQKKTPSFFSEGA